MTRAEKLQDALRTLRIEVNIQSALAAYAQQVGHDVEIEAHQAYRVSEVFDELEKLINEPNQE